ncbi:hypothetical protein [Natronomonas sp. EA1]|uniref:hypothetical protein n=1 Tax=Natronomonas sp. EA1 TaxID=3421655 RepID=UPI003EBACB03
MSRLQRLPGWAVGMTILAGGVVSAGILDFLLSQLGYGGLGAFVWAIGYGGAVFAVWLIWFRDLELAPDHGVTETDDGERNH